jgi:tetratricopeptide (TPR) repeat protein
MIMGLAPFDGETTSDVIASILHNDFPPLLNNTAEVPTGLQSVVQQALRKDREKRYQTSGELLADLKSIKRHLEFAAELAHIKQLTSNGSQALITEETAAIDTVNPRPHTTLSPGYVVNAAKRHKISVALVLATICAVATVALLFYSGQKRLPGLTEKDTLLLADFVNTTGDTVFDGTLKQALAVQLEQSPFLNIYSDERVRDALRRMERSPDERITKELAREVCERHGLKAMVTGSISSLGSHYVIGLEAVNARSGDIIARVQTEAEGKEQVLRKLGEAVSNFREKLGDSLFTIKKFNVPVEGATTSSLEAFKAFSMGMEHRKAGQSEKSIAFLERALELDSNFALAYLDLSISYGETGRLTLANEFAKKAFDLRERVSERERFYITAHYFNRVTGELDKLIDVAELWKQIYPLDAAPYNLLALGYAYTGQYEKIVEVTGEAIRSLPAFPGLYSRQGYALIRLHRFDDAEAVFKQALEQKMDQHTYSRRTF